MGKAKQIHNANKEITLRNYEQSLNRFYSQQYQNQTDKGLRDEQARETFRQNMQIREIREDARLEAYERSEQSFVDQLIFNQEAEKQALEGEEKVFNERILANAFETDQVNLNYKKQLIDSKFDFATAERGISDAVQSHETNKALISLDAEEQTIQAKGQRKSLRLRKQQARSDANTQEYRNRIEALKEEGASRARGRAGKTAQRALQSIKALSGVNSALIADQLTKSNRAIAIEKEIVDAQLGPNGLIERRKSLRTQRSRQQRDSTVRQLDAQKSQVAQALGISTEQFNMSREQLGRSLLSAAESYEQRVDQIQQQRFAADLNAYAQRQLTPRVQPSIPKPFETRLPVLIKPPRPVKPVKSKNAGQVGQNTNPVLQGISGVAGVVAAAAPLAGPAAPVVAAAAAGVGVVSNLLDKIF